MVEYPSGQRALTVNQFGYAVRWFDSSLHHQSSPEPGEGEDCPPEPCAKEGFSFTPAAKATTGKPLLRNRPARVSLRARLPRGPALR